MRVSPRPGVGRAERRRGNGRGDEGSIACSKQPASRTLRTDEVERQFVERILVEQTVYRRELEQEVDVSADRDRRRLRRGDHHRAIACRAEAAANLKALE